MIVFENGSYQINPNNPDTNYLEGLDCEQPKWVVEDNSELAGKIISAARWEAVEDEGGKLIDIIPAELSAAEQDSEEKTAELKAQLDEIDRQAIRPLRAIAAGTATEEDREILAELERQAEEIRAELAELSADNKEVTNGHTDNTSGA